jgi:hypothetical protein
MKPIVYGSKITLIHVSTGKYLSTKGVKYDFGQNGHQYMVGIDNIFYFNIRKELTSQNLFIK